ncbi:uncharacterized protein LOC118315399 [Scophthalmus maximus]|uniref:uncharacterized protein LOC118315399 n=1 Tax=Scophthalmus maximus TaxID=52904 RepID=UPI0015E12DA7|nr:uncharacterized protein LOC118315399 [Scophthalmus maximus]
MSRPAPSVAEVRHLIVHRLVSSVLSQCPDGPDPTLPWISSPVYLSQKESEIAVPSIQHQLRRVQRIWRETRRALLRTQEQNKRMADRRRTPAPKYKPSQQVWLNSKDIPLNVSSKKLGPRFIGPYVVEAVINPCAVCLKLPPALRIHPLPAPCGFVCSLGGRQFHVEESHVLDWDSESLCKLWRAHHHPPLTTGTPDTPLPAPCAPCTVHNLTY